MPVYLMCYAAAFLFARASHDLLAGVVLLFAAAVLFLGDIRGPGLPLRLRALFSLSFVGGEGIACLKLSYLETEWEPLTWAVLFLAYTVFWLVFEFGQRNAGVRFRESGTGTLDRIRTDRLFLSILIITILSWVCFLVEVRILGYVPLFLRGVPHAYSYFHVSGLHYFTVSCVLVPSFAAVWGFTASDRTDRKTAAVFLCTAASLLIPVLCVSRFQLILAVVTAGFTILLLRRGGVNLMAAALAFVFLLVLYVILTIARSHSVSYLNGIFEMKRNFPIFISQPYIYIANNYDNLNCLIRDLPRHTFGLRMLFPLWALTGLKFVFPQLVSFPLYVTKTELTTLTLFYDAWYDFGTIGVVAFSALLGALAFFLEDKMRGRHSPVFCVFYSQIAVYFALAFFTTWFSNPATWFYFAETLAVGLFVSERRARI